MKVKLFGLAAIFLLLGIQTNINSQAQDYIMLESGFGSLDKQIPVIVFSIPWFRLLFSQGRQI